VSKQSKKILDPQDKLGAANKWWLNKSLEKLNLSLENNSLQKR
jgi:hypothetical protein